MSEPQDILSSCRDAAVKRKNNTEIELAKTRIDVMQVQGVLFTLCMAEPKPSAVPFFAFCWRRSKHTRCVQKQTVMCI